MTSEVSHYRFIKLLKLKREQKGYTLEHLADIAGLHRTTLSLIERNERNPTLNVANKIADALGEKLSNLLIQAEKMTLDHYTMLNENLSCYLRNETTLENYFGLSGDALVAAIDACYKTVSDMDNLLEKNGTQPVSELFELANVSSMLGNIIAGNIERFSNGTYYRSPPHTYPDLLSTRPEIHGLELKMALEKNKPKGHLPKSGNYICIRYVLVNKDGSYTKGKENRGTVPRVWEIKIGYLSKDDFSCSNTVGDSGKTAVITAQAHNNMTLVYYVPEYSPYAEGRYTGIN